MAGHQLAHAAKDASWHRHVTEAHVGAHRVRVDLGAQPGNLQQRLELAAEHDPRAVIRVEKGLFTISIAGQDQRPRSRVPDREPKHTVESRETGIAPLLVSVNDHLGVGLGVKLVSESLELGAQLAKVVNLAVEHRLQRAVFVVHRLVTTGEIDDREPAHSDHGLLVMEQPLVVGAAMGDGRVHRVTYRGSRKRCAGCGDDARDPAHVSQSVQAFAPCDRA